VKNTIDAIKYGLETLNVTTKEMFNLVESSKGYEGDDYKRWLANEIIKIAEKDEIGYSQLLAKWFNIIQSIIEEYSDDSIKSSFENKISEFIDNTIIYSIGMSGEKENVIKGDDIDWGSKVDLPFNYDFIDSLPEDLKEGLIENKGVTIFLKMNSKNPFKKSSDIVADAKINGISLKNYESMMLYRMCTLVRALDEQGSNFKFVFIADTKTLYDKENEDIIKYFLSFFHYEGFVVKSKDLYEGSFTSEEYAIVKCTLRGMYDEVQNGFLFKRAEDVDGEFKLVGREKRYSCGEDMLDSLITYKLGSKVPVVDTPMVDNNGNIVGSVVTNGKMGYLCKGVKDRTAFFSTLPVEGTNFVGITKDNLTKVISYYGVSQAMESSGVSGGISDIIDGHPDFTLLVNNCVPLFLFDVNSKFCRVSKDVPNPFDLADSKAVKSLLDKSSVYFSFESKEFVSVCKNILVAYNYKFKDSDKIGLSFNDMRVACENEDLDKAYFNSLSRCKEFVSSLYKKM
jgi:hypothetical protein